MDIERIIRDRAEFKTMEIKCVTNLKKNLKKKVKDKERKCNVCEKMFKTEENLEKHRKEKHEQDKSDSGISELIKLMNDQKQQDKIDRAEDRKMMLDLISKSQKNPAENCMKLSETIKFSECPKWDKNELFSNWKEGALLWDSYTKQAQAAKKLNSFLESMKEHHNAEYKRIVLETLKNEDFMKKIRDQDEETYDSRKVWP